MNRIAATFLLSVIVASACVSQAVDWRSWPVRAFTPRPYDVQHYRIELRFDYPKKQFFGTTTITFVPVGAPIRSCTFDAEVMTIRSATAANGSSLAFTQQPGFVTVELLREAAPSETVQVILRYDGQQIDIDPARWGVPKTYHPGLEFLDSTADHPRLISALSFSQGARHWFPCNDHPSDKATQEVIAEVPRGWKAAANGSLVGVQSTSSASTYHWYLRQPHSTYLSVLAAGPYVVLRDSLGSLPLAYWVYPQHEPNALRSFHRTPEIIAFFERVYGVKYPWDKYDQIMVPGIGGGAEATTATILGQTTIHDERAEQDFPSHWLVAHEAAHQWWGDFITLKDWGHTWINESFATYSEYLWSRYSLGDDEGALNLQDKREQYFRDARTRFRRPIVLDRWRFPNDNFDSHTYPKGANVLHMLRAEIGDSAFSRFLKTALTEHAFGSATTSDMLRAAEKASGKPLQWFFDQWLMKPGHPVLNVSWKWDQRTKFVVLRVEQKQDTTGGVPIYVLPVTIGLTSAKGHRVEQIRLTRAMEEFALSAPEQPILVEFDEPHSVLAEITFPKTTKELIVQLEQGNALSRVFASNELAVSAGDPGVEAALRKASISDQFWGVRRAALDAMRSARAPTIAAFLKDRLSDSHPKVRAAAVRGLGSLRLRELAPFLQSRFESESSYVVQAELVRAIAATGGPGVTSFLEKASRLPSHRDIVRTAALEALATLKK